ncbi:hypothetical protein [Agromyces atrinae]|uniref:Uncharacterized protein n=1 Tax=Agromyces atrinae TaxID=592376 RepID=A0A4Q2M5K7_9MICO|nr:hypothetical protein [Agromyces atrinae]NYD66766.1 hypothetical protein [Agromyces atrinae]RXZ87424.1 hypothetical protein ESP50_05765 [Agromyces atrinae]
MPFVLSLLSGWLCGAAVAGRLLAIEPPVRGTLVHLAVVLVPTVVLVALTMSGAGSNLEALPEPLAGAALFAWFAALPGVAWVWLALLSRLTAESRRAPVTRTPRRWVREKGEWQLAIAVVPLRMSTLAGILVILVVPLGVAVAGILIAFDVVVAWSGPRFAIIALALLIGVPVAIGFYAVVRRRTRDVVVRVADARLVIEGMDDGFDILLADIASLRYRRESEYARLVVETIDGRRVSLISGLARVPREVAPELPRLPDAVIHALNLAGLREVGSSRVQRFERRAPSAG